MIGIQHSAVATLPDEDETECVRLDVWLEPGLDDPHHSMMGTELADVRPRSIPCINASAPWSTALESS
ncbi:hypothetical protein [Burkholderia ambifaria]|uniref:hypothetical protein n=1 Tax=Burkholderia ambifaria TaxID=152480 RepID=UPI0012FD1868|nr:hypothetical protein [Burkholderia ambifaria]